MNQLKQWYAGLPTWAKGAIVAAEGGAAGFLVQWAVSPQPLCLSTQCLKQFGGALVVAVGIAVRNWLRESPLKAIAEQK